MKAFLALLNVNFKSLMLNAMGIGRRKNRRKSASGVGPILLIAGIMVYVSVVWSGTMASLFAPVGGLDIMIAVMMLLGLVMSLAFTLYAAQGTLYSTKDIDLVLSMPVPTFYVMLARLLALYLEIALIVECVLIPAGVVYLLNGGAGGAAFMVLLIVTGLFIALIPALITLVFGYLISWAISRTRHKNLFNIIFSLVFTGVLVVAILFMNSGGWHTIAEDIGGMREMIFSAVPPLGWAVGAATGPNLLYFLLTLAICLVPFLVVAWLFSLNYKKLLTRLSSNVLRSDYKIGVLGTSGAQAALIKKESRRFFGTAAYFLNAGMGAILLIIAGVVALIFRGMITEFLAAFAAMGGGVFVSTYLPAILLGFMLFFLTTLMPSSVSISLEGKTLWILKEAPLSTGRVFFAKAGFAALLGIVTSVVAVPLLGIAFSLPAASILGILAICLLFAVNMGMQGLYTNLRFPRLDFENETVVIKQSASVIISMLLGFLSLVILAGVYLLMLWLGAGFPLFCLAAIVVALAMDLILYWRLNTKGRRLFAQL